MENSSKKTSGGNRHIDAGGIRRDWIFSFSRAVGATCGSYRFLPSSDQDTVVFCEDLWREPKETLLKKETSGGNRGIGMRPRMDFQFLARGWSHLWVVPFFSVTIEETPGVLDVRRNTEHIFQMQE